MKMHSLKKASAALVVAGAMVLGAPIAANAYTPDEPDDPNISGDIAPGGTVQVEFSGFEGGEATTVTLTGENASSGSIASVDPADTLSATVDASADGTVDVAVTLPEDAVGTYTLSATGQESGVTQTTSFTVGSGGDDDNGLAPTGNDMGSMLGLWIGGGALVLAGGSIVVANAVRKQRNNA